MKDMKEYIVRKYPWSLFWFGIFLFFGAYAVAKAPSKDMFLSGFLAGALGLATFLVFVWFTNEVTVYKIVGKRYIRTQHKEVPSTSSYIDKWKEDA